MSTAINHQTNDHSKSGTSKRKQKSNSNLRIMNLELWSVNVRRIKQKYHDNK